MDSSHTPGPVAAPARVAPLYAACAFGCAFLLFQVQPMVGKRILPWFGGAPGVWTLCLAFYQVTLFCGYAYAHALVRFVAPRWQGAVHAGLLGLALLSLPVLPDVAWRPVGAETPAVHILAMLAANVGLPFLFLSAGGPLVQAWFSRAAPGRSPYRLYAVSNAGSFLALLSYPFVFEPSLPLSATAGAWQAALWVVGPAVVWCAWFARAPVVAASRAPEGKVGVLRPLLWFLLSAGAVVLLMGVTNELCLDVASVPFLWVAPLGLYLATFVVCFATERGLPRGPLVAFAGLSLLALAATGMSSGVSRIVGATDVVLQIAIYAALLLAHCLMLHRELFALRPGPERLTAYYLWISAGGAVGGLLVGVGAPAWFSDYHELPLGLVGSWALLACCRWREGGDALRRSAFALVAVAVAGAFAVSRPAGGQEGRIVHQERSFFGVLRVVDIDAEKPRAHRRTLKSGTTMHGLQYVAPPRSGRPTLYYGEYTGVGFAMRAVTRGGPARIGVVGLGIGTLAAYGRAEDTFRFYEIDPLVVALARDTTHFTVLEGAAAGVSVHVGDGRIGLAQDLAAGRAPFDLLVLDAFSSDAIPVHLLTVEAFRVYTRALAPRGLLAVHVSNANLELAPLVVRLGASEGLAARVIENRTPARALQARATWVLLSPNDEALQSLERAVRARHAALPPERRDPWVVAIDGGVLASAPLFTDDYSDILGLLKRRGSRPQPGP